MSRLILLLFGSGLMVNTALAEVYKWTDSKGRTVYGDQPPPNAQTTLVRDKISVVPATENAPPSPKPKQDSAPSAQASQDSNKTEAQAKRQRMIDRCKAQRGINCEEEVDAQLDSRAQDTQPTELYRVWIPRHPPRPAPRPKPPVKTDNIELNLPKAAAGAWKAEPR